MKWELKDKMKLLAGTVVITLVIYVLFRYVLVLVWPFVLGGIIALMIEKPVTKFSGKIGRFPTKGAVATIIVFIFAGLILGIVSVIVIMAVKETCNFIKNFDYNMIGIRQEAARICLDADGWFGLKEGQCLEWVCNCGSKIVSLLPEKLIGSGAIAFKNIVLIFGGITASFISVVYISSDMDRLRKHKRAGIYSKELGIIWRDLKILANVYFKVQIKIILINSLLCGAVLSIIKNPYAIVLGFLIGLIDALPVLGTGTVLIPWALLEVLLKNYGTAALFIALYVVTYFVREIMESKCMGERLAVAPFTMLMVTFVGLLIYGVTGFITGPVSFIMIRTLVRMLKEHIEKPMLKC